MNRDCLLDCSVLSHQILDLLGAGVDTVPVERGSYVSRNGVRERRGSHSDEHVKKKNGVSGDDRNV